MGDFSTVAHLPEMYAHCKETEDPDLNILDFVGEHLMNLDGIFEPHGEADDDKPHETVVFVSQNQTISLNEAILTFEFKNNSPLVGFFSLEKIGFKKLSYFYNPNFYIFRPPIV